MEKSAKILVIGTYDTATRNHILLFKNIDPRLAIYYCSISSLFFLNIYSLLLSNLPVLERQASDHICLYLFYCIPMDLVQKMDTYVTSEIKDGVGVFVKHYGALRSNSIIKHTHTQRQKMGGGGDGEIIKVKGTWSLLS